MSDSRYIDGIQLSIDMFTPIVERHVAALEDEYGRRHPSTMLIQRLRAALRAYAEVVGHMKLKRDQAAGQSVTSRHLLFKEYKQGMVLADKLLDSEVSTPEEEQKLLDEIEAADRRIDAAVVKFALQ
ncbi:MAG TPA: hypothetical protein VGN16_12380 [Acidobacteriaceae bacterium]|jgi:hypothetical protein